jgi:hypothetical protein
LKQDMNAVLENPLVVLNDELQFCFRERFGTDMTGWKVLDMYETMQIVIAQGPSRFTVGLPLCKIPSLIWPFVTGSKQIERNNLYVTTSA